MGEIRTEVTLENADDRALVRRGHGTESEVRRTTVDGIVDKAQIEELTSVTADSTFTAPT